MKVNYNKGMGYPVEISDGKTATCISLDAAKELQANLSAVIEHAENTPEEGLTPFEDRLAEIIVSSQGLCSFDACKYKAKRSASELLALARKELEPEIKSETLKNLPRWKPAARAYEGDRLPRIDWSLNRLVARFEEGIFYLDIRELYKLPGFKEDKSHE